MKLVLLVVCVLGARVAAQLVCTNPGFGDYNVQATTRYTGRNSDIGGPLLAAVFDLQNYGVHSNTACPGAVSLSSNTGTWTNGQLRQGSGALRHQGAVTLSGVGLGSNTVAAYVAPTIPAAVSAQLCGLVDDAVVALNSPSAGAVTVSTTHPGFSVASVSLSQITQVVINRANPTDTLVINLRSGTGAVEFLNGQINIDGGSSNEANAQYVLFNTCDGISSVRVHAYGFFGSLVAPGATLRFYDGQWSGQVVASIVEGFNGAYGEFHCDAPFIGCICFGAECDGPNDALPCTTGCDTLDSTCLSYECNTATGFCEVAGQLDCSSQGDLCNPAECVEGVGCVNTPVVCSPDACFEQACSLSNGQCEPTVPISCDDQDTECLDYECDLATSTCVIDDVLTCEPSNCYERTCDTSSGVCVPDAPIVCSNDQFCTTYECDIATSTCVVSDVNDCDDADACTDDVCDEVNDVCVHTDNGTCGGNDDDCLLEIGDALNFNVYSKANVIVYATDVGGPVGAAGSVYATSFSINHAGCGIGDSSRAVVSAVSATLQNGQVYGNVVVPALGQCSGSSCVNMVYSANAPPNVDTAAISANLAEVNSALCAQSNIDTTGFRLINDYSANKIGSRSYSIAAGETLVINVHTATGWANGQVTVNGQTATQFTASSGGSRLLWNVCGAARTLTINSYALGGALLAPNSPVSISAASADGQLWVASFAAMNGGEPHCLPFSGCLCPPGVCSL